jgi:hypothetical protein
MRILEKVRLVRNAVESRGYRWEYRVAFHSEFVGVPT